jgi:hypothetical protein
MISPRYARIAARLLSDEPAANSEPSEAKRAQRVEMIARALDAKGRRQLKRAWAWRLVAAAVICLLGSFALRQFRRSDAARAQIVSAVVSPDGVGVQILGPQGNSPLMHDASLVQGSHLVTGETGSAAVRLSTGTALAAERSTNLEFENAGPMQRFFLAQGAVRAKVAKLHSGERFIVRTADAELEVRGTAFRVSIVAPDMTCAGGTRTRLAVTEGVVEVRVSGVSAYIHPGEFWPAACAPKPATEASVQPEQAASASSGAHAAHAVQVAAAKPGPSSSIAQQNALFAEASSARRQGDSGRALSAFSQLMDRYPTSPLAESSAVQRLRLLEEIAPRVAPEAARQYLERYPHGYARNDALKLLAR